MSLHVKIVFVQSQAVQLKTDVNEDLYDEVLQTLEILKRLEKPDPPKVTGELPPPPSPDSLPLVQDHRVTCCYFCSGGIQGDYYFLVSSGNQMWFSDSLPSVGRCTR